MAQFGKQPTFLIPKFTIASNATLTVFSEERLAKDCCAFLPISLQFVMSLHGAWRIRRVLWSALDFLRVLGTRSSMEAHGNRLWGGTENLKLKILSEMEVAPRYKLLTLLTMLAMQTWLPLLILLKLHYSAKTLACTPIYIVTEGQKAIGMG